MVFERPTSGDEISVLVIAPLGEIAEHRLQRMHRSADPTLTLETQPSLAKSTLGPRGDGLLADLIEAEWAAVPGAYRRHVLAVLVAV